VTDASQAARDLYYEDVPVGASYRVEGRAITEADLHQFAQISGDDHPIHTDEAYARGTAFGRRIAHGPLCIALAIGLFGRLPQFKKATLAMTDIREWKFRAPVFIGDVLSLELDIVAKTPPRRGAGIIDRRLRLLKADRTLAQEGLSGLLLACRDTAS
jgi:acyl dehydratase